MNFISKLLIGNLTDSDKKRITPMFSVLAIVYTCLILISNILASKIFAIGPIVLPAAVICFPIVWILSDFVTECYGFRISLICIKMNAIMNFLMSLFLVIAVYLPAAKFWPNQIAFESILGITWRVCLFSILGSFVGDYLNSVSLSIMKVKQNEKEFAYRSIVSSMIGQIADCTIFIIGSFIGTMPFMALLTMIVCQYIVKILFEVCCLPITTKVIAFLKKYEGDYYDEVSLSTYKL